MGTIYVANCWQNVLDLEMLSYPLTLCIFLCGVCICTCAFPVKLYIKGFHCTVSHAIIVQ